MAAANDRPQLLLARSLRQVTTEPVQKRCSRLLCLWGPPPWPGRRGCGRVPFRAARASSGPAFFRSAPFSWSSLQPTASRSSRDRQKQMPGLQLRRTSFPRPAPRACEQLPRPLRAVNRLALGVVVRALAQPFTKLMPKGVRSYGRLLQYLGHQLQLGPVCSEVRPLPRQRLSAGARAKLPQLWSAPPANAPAR